MITRADLIYYVESRFKTQLGLPYKHADRDKLERYVTLISHGGYHHRCSQMLNALGEIADRMGLNKPTLIYRLTTKFDDSIDMQRLITRVYIVGCMDYGKLRNDHYKPVYPQLQYSRAPLMLTLKTKDLPPADRVTKAIFPMLDLDPDPQGPTAA